MIWFFCARRINNSSTSWYASNISMASEASLERENLSWLFTPILLPHHQTRAPKIPHVRHVGVQTLAGLDIVVVAQTHNDNAQTCVVVVLGPVGCERSTAPLV